MKGLWIRAGLAVGLAETLRDILVWRSLAETPTGVAMLFAAGSCAFASLWTWRHAPFIGVLLLGVAAGYSSGWANGSSVIALLPWALAETVSGGRGRLLTAIPSFGVYVLATAIPEARDAQFYWAAAGSMPSLLEAAWLTVRKRASPETRAFLVFLSPLLFGISLDLLLLMTSGSTNLPAKLSAVLVFVVNVTTGLGAGYLALAARTNGKVLEMRQRTANDFLDWTEAIFREEAAELGRVLSPSGRQALRKLYSYGAQLAADDRVLFRASRPKVRVALTSHARMASTVAVFADRREITAEDVEKGYRAVQSVKAATRFCQVPFLSAEAPAA